MRILVTNDDGVDREGLSLLAQALLDRDHDVQVVAPQSDRSGSGSSVGSIEHGAAVSMRRVRLGTTPVIDALALDAPPSLAVLAAISGQFGAVPDLVVSGVNPGHNLGRSILFSGTVGAVQTAATFGVCGVAVSCGFEPEARFDTAVEVVVRVIDGLVAAGVPPVALNVNVPDVDFLDIAEVRGTRLGIRSRFALRMTEEHGMLVLSRESTDRLAEPDSDLAAVLDGAVSITVLQPMNSTADAIGPVLVGRLAQELDAARLGVAEGSLQ